MRAIQPDDRIQWLQSSPFLLGHVAAVAGVVWTGFSWSGLALAAALYIARMFGVTAGYHRYFSHRSFETRAEPSPSCSASWRSRAPRRA